MPGYGAAEAARRVVRLKVRAAPQGGDGVLTDLYWSPPRRRRLWLSETRSALSFAQFRGLSLKKLRLPG
jgi:hypothetical protein